MWSHQHATEVKGVDGHTQETEKEKVERRKGRLRIEHW